MKKIGIIILLILFSLTTFSQNVPVIETSISRNLSWTDSQLKNNEDISQLVDKYTDRDNNVDTTKMSATDNQRFQELLKLNGMNNMQDYHESAALYNTAEIGCSWYCGANHFQTISSSLPKAGTNDYSAKSIFDFDLRTAWVEGAKGYGVGEYAEVHFPMHAARATHGYLVNGYNKNERTWRNNSRVKSMNLYVDNQLIAILNLKDTRDEQSFELPQPIPSRTDTTRFTQMTFDDEEAGYSYEGKVSTLRFEIREVYAGNKYDDTAISELSFSGMDVHCIAEGAEVMMADQSTKRIEDIAKGDIVYAYMTDKQSYRSGTVKRVHSVVHSALYKVRLADGKEIIVTDDHPFLSSNGWVSIAPNKTKNYARYSSTQVNVLQKGTSIYTFTFRKETVCSQVTSIESINNPTKTYTLELDDSSAFIANGILVGQE